MDEKIKKLQKKTKKVEKGIKGLEKEESSLLKMDVKHDRIIEKARESLKKRKK